MEQSMELQIKNLVINNLDQIQDKINVEEKNLELDYFQDYVDTAHLQMDKLVKKEPDLCMKISLDDQEPKNIKMNIGNIKIRRKSRAFKSELLQVWPEKHKFQNKFRLSCDMESQQKNSKKVTVQFLSQKDITKQQNRKFIPISSYEGDNDTILRYRMVKDSRHNTILKKEKQQAQNQEFNFKKIMEVFDLKTKCPQITFDYDGTPINVVRPKSLMQKWINVQGRQTQDTKITNLGKIQQNLKFQYVKQSKQDIQLDYKINTRNKTQVNDSKIVMQECSPYLQNFQRIKWIDKIQELPNRNKQTKQKNIIITVKNQRSSNKQNQRRSSNIQNQRSLDKQNSNEKIRSKNKILLNKYLTYSRSKLKSHNLPKKMTDLEQNEQKNNKRSRSVLPMKVHNQNAFTKQFLIDSKDQEYMSSNKNSSTDNKINRRLSLDKEERNNITSFHKFLKVENALKKKHSKKSFSKKYLR